jgi:ATP-dependent helicase/DNAse subunit B
MAKRVQSPSSMGTYKQCPRKYYYQYIEKLPTSDSIHTVRGKAVHSALEDFFDINPETLNSEVLDSTLKSRAQELFTSHWKKSADDLAKLGLPPAEEMKYFEESLMMVLSWVTTFIKRMGDHGTDIPVAFKELTPIREQHYKSEEHQIRGYIDAIENIKGVVRIMDYKTSKSFDMSKYKLQLAIYALMYLEKHDKLPDKVGIYFLKGDLEKTVTADMALADFAKEQAKFVHDRTHSEDKGEYPMKMSPLCKWRTGQCDFYQQCFGKSDHANVHVIRK